jgi:Rrf2 family nitric oxide-sensitive transcriptional repressor
LDKAERFIYYPSYREARGNALLSHWRGNPPTPHARPACSTNSSTDHPMRLTMFSDYALRVLMYAAAAGDRLITIEETARAYGISRAHLMKVVNILTRTGYIRGVRGRSGGFTLAKPPQEINLGAVVRATEPDFSLVECFATGSQCIITRRCRLPNVLNEALGAFIGTLDRYTLADLALGARDFVPPKGPIRERRGPLLAAAHDT